MSRSNLRADRDHIETHEGGDVDKAHPQQGPLCGLRVAFLFIVEIGAQIYQVLGKRHLRALFAGLLYASFLP